MPFILQFASATLLVFMTACSHVPSPRSHQFGLVAKPEQHKAVGMVFYQNKGGQPTRFCGGTLLSQQIFLTAAHCIDITVPPKQLKFALVRFAIELEEDATVYDVDRIAIHPSWERRPNHVDSMKFGVDLALVRLSARVPFSGTFPNLQGEPVPGSAHTIGVGFGYSGLSSLRFNRTDPIIFAADGYGLTGNKLVHELGPVSYGPHESFDNKGTKVTTQDGVIYFLSGLDEAVICQGDSGGPLIYHDKIIGVLSWVLTYGSCLDTILAAYTSVSAFAPWIRQTVVSLSSANP